MSEIIKTKKTDSQVKDSETAAEIAAKFDDLTAQLNSKTAQLQTADAQLQTEINFLRGTLNEEITARSNSDSALENKISAETATRVSEINRLDLKIQSETLTQNVLNTQMQADISILREDLTAETLNRSNDDAFLISKIDAETATRKSEINRIENVIQREKQNVLDNLNAETATRVSEITRLETNLQNVLDNLNVETSTRRADLNELETELKNYADIQVSSNLTIAKTYTDEKFSDISGSLNDFTAPTATVDGKRGLVPAAPKGTDLKILTSKGWRTAADTTLTISNVPTQNGTLIFNNQTQSPTWLNFDNTKLAISGTTSSKNVGEYTVTFTPLDLYIWADTQDQSPKSQTWKIEILKLTKPAAAVTNFTYDGNSKNLSVSNFNSTYENQTGTISSTNVGDFSVTYKLISASNTCWEDNSTADVVINWKINKLKLQKPTANVTQFDYDGNQKTLTINNFNSTYESQTGTISATASGDYSVTFKLKSTANTCWQDNSVADVVINWKINKLKLTKPTANVTEFDFDNTQKTLTINNFNSTYESQTGTISATASGDYSVTFKLKSTANTCWQDNSVADVVINWTIKKANVAKPTAATTIFTYNGNAKTLQVTGYDSNYMNRTGDVTATNAGDYSVTFSLKNPDRVKWEDDSTADVVINWKIEPQKLSAAQSTFAQIGTLTFNNQNQTPTIQNFDATYHTISGTQSAKNSGSYEVQIAPKTNYVFSDGSSSAKIVTWKIEKVKLPKVYATQTSFEFDGNNWQLEYFNYDSNYMYATGTSREHDPGDYQFIVHLRDTVNYCWEDNSTADIVINWTIGTAQIDKPVATVTEFEYSPDGNSLAIQNYQPYFMTQEGTISAVDCGNYSVTYILRDKEKWQWSDGTTNDVTISWKITPKYLTAEQSDFNQTSVPEYTGELIYIPDYVPDYNAEIMTPRHGEINLYVRNAGGAYPYIDLNENYRFVDGTKSRRIDFIVAKAKIDKPQILSTNTYNGAAQSPSIAGGAGAVAGSDTSKTEAGTYTITFTPDSNHCWQDGSSTVFSLQWQILPAEVNIPTLKSGVTQNFNFDAQAHSHPISDFDNVDENAITVTAPTGTNYGSYVNSFTLKNSNYIWKDGTAVTKNLTWQIYRVDINIYALVTCKKIFTYDGRLHDLSPSVIDTNLVTVTGTTSAIEKGNYSYTLKLKYPASTRFYLGKNQYSTDDYTVNWSIANITLTRPTVSQTFFDYDGNNHALAISNFDSTKMTKSGVETAKNRGFYTLTISISDKDYYCWEDGGVEDIVIDWAIGMVSVPVPALADGAQTEFTYDGNAKSISIENYDSSKMTATGYLSATDAGNYSVTFSLTDKTSCVWSTGGTADISFTWKINRKPLTAAQSTFTQINIPTYDRKKHTPEISGFYSNYHTIEYLDNNSSTSKAGSYQAYISPKSNYCWSNGQTTTKSFTWKIEKLYIEIPEIVVGTGEFTYDGNAHYPQYTNNNFGAGDGMYFNLRPPSVAQTNAGEYTETFYLRLEVENDGASVFWSDGTQSDKSVTWKIKQRVLSPFIAYYDCITHAEDHFSGYNKSYACIVDYRGLTQSEYLQVIDTENSTFNRFITPTEGTATITETDYGKIYTWRSEVGTWIIKDKVNYIWYNNTYEDTTYWELWFPESQINAVTNTNSNVVTVSAPRSATVQSLQKENSELRASVLDLQRAILDLYSMTTVYND